MELNCVLKLRWKKGQAVGGNYVSVGGHQGGKTAKNGLGVGNSAVTSGNESADHTHTYPWGVSAGSTGRVGSSFQSASVDFNPNTSGKSATHTHTTTTAVSLGSGDNETRPTNRGVRYIIKV